MAILFFIWTTFFASLCVFLRNREVAKDVHSEHNKHGVDRGLEILAGYPVLIITFIYSVFYVHIPFYIFVPVFLLVGGISNVIIGRIYEMKFWIDKKPILDVISVISGSFMLFVLFYYNI